MRTRAKGNHVARDRARRENVPWHILGALKTTTMKTHEDSGGGRNGEYLAKKKKEREIMEIYKFLLADKPSL